MVGRMCQMQVGMSEDGFALLEYYAFAVYIEGSGCGREHRLLAAFCSGDQKRLAVPLRSLLAKALIQHIAGWLEGLLRHVRFSCLPIFALYQAGVCAAYTVKSLCSCNSAALVTSLDRAAAPTAMAMPTKTTIRENSTMLG